jgi:hypothetical protein
MFFDATPPDASFQADWDAISIPSPCSVFAVSAVSALIDARTILRYESLDLSFGLASSEGSCYLAATFSDNHLSFTRRPHVGS